MHAAVPRLAPATLAIAILGLPANSAESPAPPAPNAADFGLDRRDLAALAARDIPLIDFHVHLRGGMTVEKALARQQAAGIRIGVLRNIGAGWPIETDDQLRAFLDRATGRGLLVGLQVNDRDWHTRHDRGLLDRCDYILGDTMIMPMPADSSPPVKLWQPEHYTIAEPQAWMERYLRHNLRVLAEPITILANPTYLPPPVEDRYDELWTDARMKTVIAAAVANRVALEINARSGYPRERFIRMAKRMGARFSFGSNNFDADPIDMSRCLKAIDKYGLDRDDLYVPAAK
jgi:hypothetical protein